MGVATSKAGTSWWYSLLLKHPQVTPNRLGRKELTYFQHFGFRGLTPDQSDAYRQAFARPKGVICGEWSPGYLTYPFTTEHLRATTPDTKLLAILRNPIDRAVSLLNQLMSARAKYLNLRGHRQRILEVFSLFPQAFAANPYASPLERVLRLFPRDQVLVLQYEKCKVEPTGEFAKTCKFLEIDDTVVPEEPTRAVNKKPYLVAKPDREERRLLADYFSADVAALKRLLPENDVHAWADFR